MFHHSIISKGVLTQNFTSWTKLCVLPFTDKNLQYTTLNLYQIYVIDNK